MVIILLILIPLSLDNVWILLGENCFWSLLALKGLKALSFPPCRLGQFVVSPTVFLDNALFFCTYVQECYFVGQLQITNSIFRISLRKQPTFGNATTGFPAKPCLRNERRNSTLMTRHYHDLGSASDWLYCMGNLIQPIRRNTQIWVVMHHQCGISALVSQTSFGGETSGSIAKCLLFSQA